MCCGLAGELMAGMLMSAGEDGTIKWWGALSTLNLLLHFFPLVTGPRRSLSLKLSDTRVYEPQIQARLGTC